MAPVFSQMNSLLLKLLTQRTRACLCGWVCLCTRAHWRTHKRARTQAHVKKHLEEVGGGTLDRSEPPGTRAEHQSWITEI